MDPLIKAWKMYTSLNYGDRGKDEWLEVFLAHFLRKLTHEQDIKMASPHPMPNMTLSNVLSEQLLQDVQEVCTQEILNTEDDLEPLKSYLLRGRGWRLLAALHFTDLHNLSCGTDLAHLLISLYPVVPPSDVTKLEPNPFLPPLPFLGMEDFWSQLGRKPLLKTLKPRSPKIPPDFDAKSKSKVKRGFRSPPQHQKYQEELLNGSESESASPGANARTTPPLVVRFNPKDFDYFSRVTASEDNGSDVECLTPLRWEDVSRARRLEDERNLHALLANESEFNLQTCSAAQVRDIIVSLLLSVAQVEAQAENKKHQHYNIHFPEVLMDFALSGLQDRARVNREQLGYKLLRLLFVAGKMAVSFPDEVFPLLEQEKFVPQLLKLLDQQPSTANNELFHAEGLYGLLQCLVHLSSSPVAVQSFEAYGKLLQHVFHGPSGKIFVRLLTGLCNNESAFPIVAALAQLSQAWGALVNQVTHVQICRKAKHKHCVTAISGHHFEFAPEAFPAFCLRRAIFKALLELFHSTNSEPLQLQVVTAALQAGVCCCTPPNQVFALLWRWRHGTSGPPSLKAWKLLFAQLAPVAFTSLGFTAGNNETCEHCRRWAGFEREKYLEAGEYFPEEALVSQGDLDSPVEADQVANWLVELRELLLHETDRFKMNLMLEFVCFMVNHTEGVADAPIREEIFLKLVYPAVLHIHPESGHDRELVLLERCLTLLPPLLQAFRIAELFTNLGGMSHLTAWSVVPRLGPLVASILEPLVRFEFRTQDEDEISLMMTSSPEVKGELAPPQPDMPAVWLLTSLIVALTQALLKLMGVEKGEESRMCQMTGEGEKQMRLPKGKRFRKSSLSHSATLQQMASQLGLPQALYINTCFWKTAAILSVQCPMFLKWLKEQPVFKETELVLLSATDALAQCTEEEQRTGTLAGLLEAVLCVDLVSGSEKATCLEQLVSKWKRLNPTQVSKLKLISNVLLNCSTLGVWLQNSPAYKVKVPNQVVSAPDEGEESDSPTGRPSSVLLGETSGGDTTTGYEADTEPCNGFATLSNPSRYVLTSESHPSTFTTIVFPHLCATVLELLSTWHAHFENHPSENPEDFLKIVTRILSRLVSLCQDATIGAILAQNNFVALVLQASHSFVRPEPAYRESRVSWMLLFATLAKHRITSTELKTLLSFFKEAVPPLSDLIWPLVDIIRAIPRQPPYIVGFPARAVPYEGVMNDTTTSGAVVSPPSSLLNVSRLALSQELQISSQMGRQLGKFHAERGVASAWQSMALYLPLCSDGQWSPRQQGFAVSMWFLVSGHGHQQPTPAPPQPRLNPYVVASVNSEGAGEADWREASMVFSETGNHMSFLNYSHERQQPIASEEGKNEKAEPTPELHLFSVGSKTFLVEFWSDPVTESIMVMATEATKSSNTRLAHGVLGLRIPGNQWHHLTVNCWESSSPRKRTLHVCAMLNGCQEAELALEIPVLSLRRSSHTALMIGTSVAVPAGTATDSPHTWYLGSVMFFRGTVFTRESAFYTYALGPSCLNLSECHSDEFKPQISSVLSPQILRANLTWEAILQSSEEQLLKPLQENLLLSYSAVSAHLMSIYPYVTTPSAIAADPRATQQPPVSVPVTLAAEIQAQVHWGIQAALEEVGGTATLLFVLARVVELHGKEEEQADALAAILEWQKRRVPGEKEMDWQGLLKYVLASERCQMGPYMLKAMLDAASTGPVLRIHPTRRTFHVASRTEALIADTQLLELAFRCWSLWNPYAPNVPQPVPREVPGRSSRVSTSRKETVTQCQEGVFGLLLRSIQALVRDDHPHRAFNVLQLERMKVLELLLDICKEHFFLDEKTPLTLPTCSLLVDVFRALVGSPPKASALEKVAKFVLMTHPAATTYVSHTWSSFYFLLAPLQGSREKRASSWTQSHRHTPSQDLSNLSTSGSGVEVGGALAAISLPNVMEESYRTVDHAHPIDPLQLSKALANLQIKWSDEKAPISPILEPKAASVQISPPSRNGFSLTVSSAHSCPIPKAEKPCKEVATVTNGVINHDHISLDEDFDLAERKTYRTDLTGDIDTSPEFFQQSETQTEEWQIMSNDPKSDYNSQTKSQSAVLRWEAGTHIATGFLWILRDAFRCVMPDSMARSLAHTLQLDFFIVLANHPEANVRTAVVKALDALLHRLPAEEVQKFLKKQSLWLLANQLHQYPAVTSVVEACLSFGSGVDLDFESLTDPSTLWAASQPSSLQSASWVLLLAAVPNATHDPVLFHNLISLIKDLCVKVPVVFKTLLDSGLLECLVKALVSLAHVTPSPSATDVFGQREDQLLLEDIQRLMVYIANQAIITSGPAHQQVFQEQLLLLQYLERIERETCGYFARCVSLLRQTSCILLRDALEAIQGAICGLQFQQKWSGGSASHAPDLNAAYLTGMEALPYVVPTTSLMGGANHITGHALRPGLARRSMSITSGPSSSGKKLHFGKEATRVELTERFKWALTKAVDVIVFAGGTGEKYEPSDVEVNFTKGLAVMVLQCTVSSMEKRPQAKGSSHEGPDFWRELLWSCKDVLKAQLARLVKLLLSPLQLTTLRLFAVKALHQEPSCSEILKFLKAGDTKLERQLMSYLEDLKTVRPGNASETDSGLALRIQSLLVHLGQLPFVEGDDSDDNNEVSSEEFMKTVVEEAYKARQAWWAQNEDVELRVISENEAFARHLMDLAMKVTRNVVDVQNAERKACMETMKMAFSQNVQVKQHWKRLVQQLTHERAIFHFPQSYPKAWQLDSTEGPQRIRKRVRRCYLQIGAKYIRPEMQHILEPEKHSPPMAFLFEQPKSISSSTSSSAILVERIHTHEKIRYSCNCAIVTPFSETPGEVLVGETCIYYVADTVQGESLSQISEAESESGSIFVWAFDDVTEIHKRRYELRDVAMEFFLSYGKTYFLAFNATQDRDAFTRQLLASPLPHLLPADGLSDVTHLWREGQITNFEYLTYLNKMAGRSFNDLMQYPVFPFILSDYASPTLDLQDPQIYRNLKKPIAVQEAKQERHFVNTFNYLKQELAATGSLNHPSGFQQGPFHYGSHYSNSGIVLHFLVRLPPFTRMFLAYQDHNFDIPDRTFHSLQTTWRLASSDSTTDVKELIPEFFFLPEMLRNDCGFNFGVRQSGERVDDVILPPWCGNNARKFVLIHRQALESDFVTEHLHHWIDLVFGYKQTGQAAVDAINVFHPATYFGFEAERIEDPIEREARQTMVKTYGQTPMQLFKSPHPMTAQNLLPQPGKKSSLRVLPTVENLKWGELVGSPSQQDPNVAWKHNHACPIATLVPLKTGDVFGLGPNTCVVLEYTQDKAIFNLQASAVLGAGLILWDHADGIIRVKLKRDQPTKPLIKSSVHDPVCICACAPEARLLWVGHLSGLIKVYQLSFDASKGTLELKDTPVTLQGHQGPICCIQPCPTFSVVVSSSQDGTCILWDSNSLTYVRTLGEVENGPLRTSAVTSIAISGTLGDVVTVAHLEIKSSRLALYTINGELVNAVTSSPLITAVCFSNAPEGTCVNVVVTGHNNGLVRLWSSWDLTALRELGVSEFTKPVISLCYSADAQHLYASGSDGTVVVWERPGTRRFVRTPRFLNLSLL